MVSTIREQIWRLRRQDNNVRLELACLEKAEEMLQKQAEDAIIDCLPSRTKRMDITKSVAALETLQNAPVMKYVSGVVQATRDSIQAAVVGIVHETPPQKTKADSQFWTAALEAMSYFFLF